MTRGPVQGTCPNLGGRRGEAVAAVVLPARHGEEGQITVEAAQMPGTMVDVYAVGWPTNMTIIVPSGKLT